MRVKISDVVKARMARDGYKLIGRTKGAFSFAKNSNLSKKLKELGLRPDQVEVCTGARAGARKNDGYELLIFVRK